MNNPKYRNKGTRLSKFTWELKDQGINFQVKWRIVDRAPPYNPRTRKCALCTRESWDIAVLELSEHLDLETYIPSCLARTSDRTAFDGDNKY